MKNKKKVLAGVLSIMVIGTCISATPTSADVITLTDEQLEEFIENSYYRAIVVVDDGEYSATYCLSSSINKIDIDIKNLNLSKNNYFYEIDDGNMYGIATTITQDNVFTISDGSNEQFLISNNGTFFKWCYDWNNHEWTQVSSDLYVASSDTNIDCKNVDIEITDNETVFKIENGETVSTYIYNKTDRTMTEVDNNIDISQMQIITLLKNEKSNTTSFKDGTYELVGREVPFYNTYIWNKNKWISGYYDDLHLEYREPTVGDSEETPVLGDSTQKADLNETPTGIRGDVNYDGEVDAIDLLLLKKYILQIITW